MHISSYKFGKLFHDTYVKNNNIIIVDVGSLNLNGSLKNIFAEKNKYIGVDLCEGKDVDIIIDDPYKLPFDDNSVDIVLSTSCFEHCEFFWVLFTEIMRILKPSGLFYLNAPSNGRFHRYPFDYWRFYPDSGLSLQNWSIRNGYNTVLLESMIGNQTKNSKEKWNDFVAVFLKDKKYINLYPDRIQNNFDDYTNGHLYNTDEMNKFTNILEDQKEFYQLNNN